MAAGRAARRPRGWRWLRRLGALAGLAAIGWTTGFLWFVAAVPDHVPEPTRQTDAIVVLTGGSGRVNQGLRLLNAERAEHLFVSGVYEGVDVDELLAAQTEPSNGAACCVSLGYDAQTTRGNARETAAWIADKEIGSVRLVTAAYHMPRSLLEFRRVMPGIEIVPHPVFPEHVKHDAWWRWPGSAALLAREYNKMLVTVLRGLVPEPA
jgi:uncharacterized SAM-binding protein YcdF (DUF218 family)